MLTGQEGPGDAAAQGDQERAPRYARLLRHHAPADHLKGADLRVRGSPWTARHPLLHRPPQLDRPFPLVSSSAF